MQKIVSCPLPRGTLVLLVLLLAPPRARAQAQPDGFSFGSYGRVGVGSDLRGATPQAVNVVSHGSRIVEPSYLELDVYYRKELGPSLRVRTVTTLGALGDPFHYTGDFTTRLALRNLFAEIGIDGGLSFWAGSRMLRGDDIYLLDWWPLDEVNTVGGGVSWRRDPLELAAHAGVSRVIHPFQLETDLVPARDTGATEIVTLDRQRWIASLQGTLRWEAGPAWKTKLYLEAQGLPSGERERDDGSVEPLPSDFGWTAGAQLGVSSVEGRSHANLFVRFSQGLAAYPDLTAPWGFDETRRTFPGATELVVGLSANLERGRAGVLLGGYVRRFESAAPGEDPSDGWEWIADARGWILFRPPFQAALDVSWQQRFAGAMSPTALDALDPAVFQLAPMLVVGAGGSYARPQLRLVYRLAHLSDGALDLYPLDDPRRDHAWVHYLGVQAEWWVSSSYL